MAETANFDHYEVLTREDGSLHELGRGGMGITYKAFDTNLRITVALKVINAAYLKSEVAQQRFIREARSAAKLRNRHVASVFHLATTGDTWFYAMEFINGETLGALIKRQGSLETVFALKVTAQVARALNAAAHHGLVHRDIKPDNLMLVEDDDELVVKVIDFGLAKSAVATGEDQLMVSMGGFVGTAHFASPEQWEEKEIDSRSDIYSLGVTLWYMLTGEALFSGSMPQVMTKHLTTSPPFEKLGNVPPGVTDLLRKMLAKDPADRFQTPAELRKAIEALLGTIASGTADAGPSPDAIAPEEEAEMAALLAETPTQSGRSSFETNTTIANRYQVGQSCGETNAGHVFRAYDNERKSEVRLIVLHPETLGDQKALTSIEQTVHKAVTVEHPNLLRVFGFETVDRGSFLVVEWTEGFSLLELLKARRMLMADEVLKLLSQAAEGVDYALGLGLNGLDFGLHQVQIHFSQPIEREKLLRAPLTTWPEFNLKLYPLGGTREISSSLTWAGAQTMVWGLELGHAEDDVRPEYVQALAVIAYEALGGTLSPFALRGSANPAAHYTPLATLSEEGNEVVRRALDRSRSFPSAHEFVGALAGLHGHSPQGRRRDLPLAALARAAQTAASGTVDSASQRADSRRMAIMCLLALAIVAGTGIFLWLNPFQKKTDMAAKPVITKGSNEERADNIRATATSEPSTPAMTAPATPAPGPSRQEILMASLNNGKALDKRGEWAKSLGIYLSAARDYPESPVGKNYLETLLEHLRARPSPISFEEFQTMRADITEAAQMDVLSAMLLLGDNLRRTEQRAAFNWYSKAAAKGDRTAETAIGFLLSHGVDTDPPDPDKAFEHFQTAANKGDIGAKFALGQCYSGGLGVTKDMNHALQLFREAADAGDTRAMTSLGDLYVHGETGKLSKKEALKEALRLFGTARERGNVNAAANLGVLYLKGLGVPPNPKKAAEIFAAGAEAEENLPPGPMIVDYTCMLFYAQCLESGTGVNINPDEAKKWYIKAAKAGNQPAIDWCNLRSIPISAGQ